MQGDGRRSNAIHTFCCNPCPANRRATSDVLELCMCVPIPSRVSLLTSSSSSSTVSNTYGAVSKFCEIRNLGAGQFHEKDLSKFYKEANKCFGSSFPPEKNSFKEAKMRSTAAKNRGSSLRGPMRCLPRPILEVHSHCLAFTNLFFGYFKSTFWYSEKLFGVLVRNWPAPRILNAPLGLYGHSDEQSVHFRKLQ